MASRIRRRDTVLVITGKDKGKRGEVLRVLPKKGLVVVSGVNIVIKHVSQRRDTRQTGLVSREAPMSASKVMLVDAEEQRAGRVGWRFLQDGSKERYVKGVTQTSE